ncbi:MAG: carboxymuconolactone decarboxylase family protein [Anaerolineaceae bacterium]|nr:carboxymuconolactone decarboxylase family protein [Anaerolineaceae bacterium]
MPYIEVVSDAEAQGAVKRELDRARQRAGRVWNIVRIMTPNAEALRTCMDFYSTLMFGKSPLSRAQREMLAVVVSKVNHCRY